MKKCKNKDVCNAKHKRWKENQSRFIEKGERELELFKEKTDFDAFTVRRTAHAKKRDFERVVREKDIADVTEFGWVIERNINFDTLFPRVLIMGYTRNHRPLHLVYEIQNKEWLLITVYTPVSDPQKWNKSYTERVCFCK